MGAGYSYYSEVVLVQLLPLAQIVAATQQLHTIMVSYFQLTQACGNRNPSSRPWVSSVLASSLPACIMLHLPDS